MKHLYIFGSPCHILNDGEPRRKFNAKRDESVFLGYYTNSRAYRVYNKITKAVIESTNVQVNDYLPLSETSRLEDPMVSILEVEKTLNNPKDAPPSVEHLAIADVWTTKDSLQQQDDHNSVEHFDIQV